MQKPPEATSVDQSDSIPSVQDEAGATAKSPSEDIPKNETPAASAATEDILIKQKFTAAELRDLTNINGNVTYMFEAVWQKKKKEKDKKKEQGDDKTAARLEDPTQPLPRRPVELLDLEIADIDQILSELSRHRILLLSSFEPEPAVAAAYSILWHESFSSYDKRALVLDKTSHQDRVDLNLEILSHPKLVERKKQLIFVEIDDAGLFLDSFIKLTHTKAGTMRDLLQDRDSILVCTASSQILKLRPDQRMPPAFSFCHRPIPFLPYVLRRHFTSERAKELEGILQEQAQRGLWQKDDFYEQISFYLLDGPERLEEVVRRIEAIPRGLSIRESLDQTQPVKAADLFRDDCGVHAAVLYAATYFPDLTPQDFERIVLLLLADRTATQEKEEQTVSAKGEVQTRKVTFEKPLAALWREAPDRILRECELRATTLRDGKQGTHSMEFTLPYLRRELRALLESRYPMFLVRMFDRLQATGLLFALDASSQIFDNLVRLFVERALSDPSFCNKKWLFRFVIGVRIQLNVPLDAADPEDQFFQLLAKIQSDQLRRHLVTRLTHLLREMIQHDETRQTVRDFFSALLTSHEHQAALEILLDLAQRLRFAAEFDALLWMRRLIDQGGSDMREQTYQCIFNLAISSGPRILEILETLHGWLPEETRSRSKYSQSNLYALRFLLEYASSTILAFSDDRQGEWPCRYSLFAALPDDPNALQERTELLCGWLLHRDMPSILATKGTDENQEGDDLLELDFEFTDYEEVHAFFVADLMEHWLLILEGTGAGVPDARRMGEALIGALARLAPRDTSTRVVRRWQWRQQEYVLLSGSLPITEREQRRRLLDRRKKVIDLKQRFLASRTNQTTH